MRPPFTRLSTALTVVGTVATVGATLAPAGATAVPPGTATGGPSNVTVFLKAPRPAALTRLAADTGLGHAARLAALQRLLPSAAERRTAISALRAAGFRVTEQTSWSISATAAPAAVSHAFGARAAAPADASPQQTAAAGGPLPTMPAALARVASAVYPTTGGPKLFHAAAARTVDGAALRNAYTSPERTAAGNLPYSGQGGAGPVTVATIQLAGWNSGDLATYADKHGLALPAGAPTQVPVGLTSIPRASKDGSDVEVDLDQEALLSADPYANQRVYFAHNTAAGFADAFGQVLDDVLPPPENKYAYQGGDPHIVALSTSWGQCEAGTESGSRGDEIRNVLEPILKSLVAAGVTVFSSSGDDGIYDECYRSHHAAVDYPASSPEVVAVGGTTLTTTSNSPNTGGNWAETAWNCTSYASCFAGGGGGGGESALLPKPSWQKRALTAAPWAGDRRRLVPDISSDANPATGFAIYTTDPTLAKDGEHNVVFGGTSFAAPTQAALFANLLAARGLTTGIGDIHAALYAALGDGNAFRDVTSGSNGAAADATPGTTVKAGVGYDTVSGLGAPLWPGLAAYLFPSTAPTATASLTLPRLERRSDPNRLRLVWSTAPSSTGSPVTSTTVTLTRVGHSRPVVRESSAAAGGSLAVTGSPGSTYTLNVAASDAAGNLSKTARRTVVVPLDDPSFAYSNGWRRSTSGSAVGGSFARTGSAAAGATATASIRATGREYRLLAPVGPTLGRMLVTVAGQRARVVNLHAAGTGFRLVIVFTGTTTAARRITLSAARGSQGIGIDALWAIR